MPVSWGNSRRFNASSLMPGRNYHVTAILVVEDEEMLRDLLSSTLENDGYRVLTAQDGPEAIEIFRTESERIDAVISDMGLPKQSGLEVFLKMKGIKPDVTMVIMSGFLETDARTSLLRSGVKAVMDKPFLSEEVLNTLRMVVARKPIK